MAKPSRNANPLHIQSLARTFFVTTNTHRGKALLQSDRNAMLFVDVLRSGVVRHKFQVRDFVIMPNHVHLLLTVDSNMSIERAMQLIKGGFSYRIRTELGYAGEVWQPGFSESRVYTNEHLQKCRDYIALNPVRAGVVASPELFPYCLSSLMRKKQRLKPSE